MRGGLMRVLSGGGGDAEVGAVVDCILELLAQELEPLGEAVGVVDGLARCMCATPVRACACGAA